MPCQLVLGISALAAVYKSLSWAVTSPVLSGNGGEGTPPRLLEDQPRGPAYFSDMETEFPSSSPVPSQEQSVF